MLILYTEFKVLYSFGFLIVFFFLCVFCRINTRWPNTMEQWTLSVKLSGEMRDSLRRFSFFLDAVFESEIFQRSKIYTLKSRLLALAFLSTSRYEGVRGFYKGLVSNVLR